MGARSIDMRNSRTTLVAVRSRPFAPHRQPNREEPFGSPNIWEPFGPQSLSDSFRVVLSTMTHDPTMTHDRFAREAETCTQVCTAARQQVQDAEWHTKTQNVPHRLDVSRAAGAKPPAHHSASCYRVGEVTNVPHLIGSATAQ